MTTDNGWISTAEQLPTDNTPVLTHRMVSYSRFKGPTDEWAILSWNVPQWADNQWFDGDERWHEKEDITSWQPLTSPNAESAPGELG